MRTAIYVYQPSTVRVYTSESGLSLCQMGGSTPIPLAASNTLSLGVGIYKIESSQSVTVTVESQSVTTGLVSNDKDKHPEGLPPGFATSFSGINLTELQNFFAFADGRHLAIGA